MKNNNSLPASVRQVFDQYVSLNDQGRAEEAELALREAAVALAKAAPQFAALVLSGAPGELVALIIAASLGYNELEVSVTERKRDVTHVDNTLFGYRFKTKVSSGYSEKGYVKSQKLKRNP